MPIVDLQRQSHQIGRIRFGELAISQRTNNPYPVKLETFKLTSPSRPVIEAAARVFGGQVEPFTTDRSRDRWQIITEVDEFPVVVPPGQAVVSQWYELWTGAGCMRRCDGRTTRVFGGEQGEEQKPCLCPADHQARKILAADGKACKATTRLSVVLPDLPDLGVWRVDSGGYYAAVELGQKAELLEKARDAGVMLPAVLRLEQREKRVPGKPPKQYGVPVLEIQTSLRELAAGNPDAARVLPPAPPALALQSGGSRPARAIVSAPPAPAWPAQSATVTAQQIADHARERCNTAEAVSGCGRRAQQLGLLEEMIEPDPGDGVYETLDSYLRVRLTEVQRQSQPAGPNPHQFTNPSGADRCELRGCGQVADHDVHGGQP